MSQVKANGIQGWLEENKGVTQTVANVAAWSAAFGGIAATLASGIVIIPLGAAAIGAGLGYVVTRKLDRSQKS